MTLGRRLQVLLEEEQYTRLERVANRRGISVARLVREAIDAVVPADDLDRRRAASLLLDADPMPIDDWSVLKDEITGRFDVAESR